MNAVRVVDEVLRQIGVTLRPSGTLAAPVHGGDLVSLDGLVQEIYKAALPWGFTRDRVQALARNHGTGYGEIFDLVREDPNLAASLPGTRVLKAEVVHAARMEMALTLDDLIHRRTDMGLWSHPEPALEEAAFLMGQELGWTTDRTRREVAKVLSFPGTVTGPVPEFARS